MPDKLTEFPIIREAILKYNSQDAFSMLQSASLHFNNKKRVQFLNWCLR